jgi:uroporphyrinogen-III synthase
MRVIVTRPAAQAGKWVKALRAAGLEALALPLIEIVDPADRLAVLAAWQRVAGFNALMFVSANAVEHFFALQPPGSAYPELQARCFATGPGTVAALLRVGVPQDRVDAPDLAASQFDSEALWQVVQHLVVPGWRVLIVRGNTGSESADGVDASQGLGRDWLATRLTERGATVEFVVSYERRAPELSAPETDLVRAAAADGSVWLFSSSEALGNLRAIVSGQSWAKGRAVATHPRIAQAAREAGFGRVYESRPAMAELIASIESLA